MSLTFSETERLMRRPTRRPASVKARKRVDMRRAWQAVRSWLPRLDKDLLP